MLYFFLIIMICFHPYILLIKCKIWQKDGESVETVTDFILQTKSLQMVIAAMKLKDAYSLEEKL